MYLATEVVWPTGAAHRETDLNRTAEMRRRQLERVTTQSITAPGEQSEASSTLETGALTPATLTDHQPGWTHQIARRALEWVSRSLFPRHRSHLTPAVTSGDRPVVRDTMEW